MLILTTFEWISTEHHVDDVVDDHFLREYYVVLGFWDFQRVDWLLLQASPASAAFETFRVHCAVPITENELGSSSWGVAVRIVQSTKEFNSASSRRWFSCILLFNCFHLRAIKTMNLNIRCRKVVNELLIVLSHLPGLRVTEILKVLVHLGISVSSRPRLH